MTKRTETSNKRATLICSMLTSFMTTFMGSSVILAVPAIGREFHTGAVALGWMVTIYLLASATLSIPFGRLADRVGRKNMFLTGIVLFVAGSGLCATAHSMGALLIFRLLQGAASAMIFSTVMALLVDAFPPDRRGVVLGYSTSATYLGLSTGPVLGGWMTLILGWRSIFWGAVLIGILAAVVGALFVRNYYVPQEKQQIDRTGILYYCITTAGLLYGLSALTESRNAPYVLAVSLLLFPLFIRHEQKQEHPLIPIQLFLENRGFALSNLAALINYSATFAIGYLVSMYLQLVQHFNSGTAGMIMLSQPLTMAIVSPLAGRLSDRLEPRIVSSIGMGISALGLFGLLVVSRFFHTNLMVVDLLFIGLGLALFSAPNSSAVMGTVERNLYSLAASVLATMRLMGQAFSMAIVSLILSFHTAGSTVDAINPAGLTTGLQQSMLIFGVLCGFGIFASLSRGRMHSSK